MKLRGVLVVGGAATLVGVGVMITVVLDSLIVVVIVLTSDVVRSNVFVLVMVVGEGLFPKRSGMVMTVLEVIFVVNVEVVTYVVRRGGKRKLFTSPAAAGNGWITF